MMSPDFIKPSIIVSACLLGYKCRYNGKSSYFPILVSSLKQYQVIPVCPEVLGGLPIPRPPLEISNGDGNGVWAGSALVLNEQGANFTSEFQKGALNVLKLCRKHEIKMAILKEKSPSCGSNQIYDGTFSKRIIPGSGVTASLLKNEGIEVISEQEWLMGGSSFA
jgi:uncharacterized protein YbbK (DUF523 family)